MMLVEGALPMLMVLLLPVEVEAEVEVVEVPLMVLRVGEVAVG